MKLTSTQRNRRSMKVSGFTLIEMLLVLGIIGLLAGSAIYLIGDVDKPANLTVAKTDIKTLETALRSYKLMNKKFPTTEEGLAAVAQSGAIKKVPIDPWGNPYQYQRPSRKSGDQYDIWSLGEDGQEGTEDDIGSWQVE